jgi:predicted neuraminidase
MIQKIKSLFTLTLLLGMSCTSKPKKPEVSNVTQEYIFNQSVTNNCHAATITEIMPGQLMAAWFGGSHEGAKDVGIYISTYNGKEWSAPGCPIKPLVTAEDTLPCWNPVLFKSQSNCLYLFYKIGKNPREWFGAMVTSNDNGKTWSAPQYLPDGILGPIKNKPIETSPGTILCGSSTESMENNQWRVHVECYTESSGKWEKIPVENKKGFDIIQPTFLAHPGSTIQMLCRSKHNKLITSLSEDNGKSWSRMDSLDVINSNSGIDALSIANNSFLLVNNPLPQGAEWYNGRNVLDVEYSANGLHWEKLLDLENQDKGEFSYPAIIQASDGRIHILYTYNRKYIKHVAFDLVTKNN